MTIQKFIGRAALTLALLGLTLSGWAQPTRTLLWKVSGNGLSAPSYVYGTVHITCAEDLAVSEVTQQAFAQTQQVVLELDMDDPSLPQQLQQASVNPGMANLSDQFSEADRAAVNAFLKQHYGADLTQLGVLKPFALLSMITMKGLTCEQTGAFETLFVGMAQASDKPLHGLETVAEQTSLFDAVPTGEQIGWVSKYARDTVALREGIAEMMAAYQRQDLDELLAITLSYPEYASLNEALLFERNEKWIGQMAEMARQSPTFFAVGAGHLASDRGVLALLRDAGFEVTPVTKAL